ncbi:MAG TPA: single-stranded-DNA-specific exonuclease RecJ, partial [Spirochaetales bacterium]|nr:single-stranded-DNA-specific exonuclease RecJ [Spirochaetales bacterium]
MNWNKKEAAPQTVKDLSKRFGIDLLSASILARRGISAPGEVLYFLEDDYRWLRNPFLFTQMEDAVDRILLAADEGEKVMVFGDRDADGISATTVMVDALTALGITASWRLPQENERYGLSKAAIDEHAQAFGSLIITVDCGISNHDEIEYASGLGIDVIVVDHHVLQAPEAPPALAVLDPKLPDSGYPFRELSGCAVAYKLAWALRFAKSGLYKQDVALLNVRPVQDAYVIEALALSNLAPDGRLSETVVPGMVDLNKTRLVPFLKNRQIFVWDGELQRKLLAKALGKAAEVQCHDVRPDVAALIPQASGQSLLRLSSLSRSGKYAETEQGELDTFASLFVSFALKNSGCGPEAERDALQLVALSTVADLMPLVDENRTLVRLGLAALNKTPRRGIAELLARQNTSGKRLGSVDVSWLVTPVINAAGRMGQPDVALSLLLEEDPGRRAELADKLLGLNGQRKQLGADCWEAMYPVACECAEQSGGKYIIVGDKRINRGITGILASRLADTFKAPAVALTFMDDGSAVGSIRSARGFNVKELLDELAPLFIDYGGHDAAAGFSMDASRWPEFQKRAQLFFSGLTLDEHEASISVDAELPHDYVNPALSELVERFEPYGEGNP